MKFLSFDESRDFPYYDHNPKLSKTAWFILLLLIPISFLIYGIVGLYSEFIGSLCFCLTLLIPLLYFSNWDYSLIFYKPSKDEIILAVILFVAYFIYAIVVGELLDFYHLSGTNSVGSGLNVNIEMIISLVFSLMAEELIKFIPLMFFIRFVYKFTENRNLAIVLSVIIVLIGFGLLHYDVGISIFSLLLIQGLGSLFDVYGYLKTKNLFVSYLTHLLTDVFIMSLTLLGFS